jgi:anti-sigma regulatory factor (Ser/Thr protein kinase)
MNAFDVSASFDRGLDDLDRLHPWLDSLASAPAAMPPALQQRLRLALVEAFTNAVEHGQSAGTERPVTVRIRYQPDSDACVRLDVTDHGPGFRLGPAAPPSEHAERGRGLIILRALAEQIDYADHTLSLRLRP